MKQSVENKLNRLRKQFEDGITIIDDILGKDQGVIKTRPVRAKKETDKDIRNEAKALFK